MRNSPNLLCCDLLFLQPVLSWKTLLGSSRASLCDVLFKSRPVISLFCQFYHFHPPLSSCLSYMRKLFQFPLFKAVFSHLYRLNRCRWAMRPQWKLMLRPLVVFHDLIWLSTTWRLHRDVFPSNHRTWIELLSPSICVRPGCPGHPDLLLAKCSPVHSIRCLFRKRGF